MADIHRHFVTMIVEVQACTDTGAGMVLVFFQQFAGEARADLFGCCVL